MALKSLLKEKQDSSEKVRRLTISEYEPFMQDMTESGKWMKQELKKRKLAREGRGEIKGAGSLLESVQG